MVLCTRIPTLIDVGVVRSAIIATATMTATSGLLHGGQAGDHGGGGADDGVLGAGVGGAGG